MVLVLAAIYSYYKSKQERAAAELALAGNSGGVENDSSNNGTTTEQHPSFKHNHTPRPRRRRPRQSSPHMTVEQIKRSGSMLYETAVLRCSPSGAANTVFQEESKEPSGNHNEYSHNDTAMSSPVSRRSSRQSTSCDTTAMEQSSSALAAPLHLSPEIKREWINACFGSDFLVSTTSDIPTQGSALAGAYQTQTVHLSPPIARITTSTAPHPASSLAVDTTSTPQHPVVGVSPLGLTISRLAIGVYVKSVLAGSEAAAAGVLPDSVLVRINDLPVLSEPTANLLERLWQYEGYRFGTSSCDDRTKHGNNNTNGFRRQRPTRNHRDSRKPGTPDPTSTTVSFSSGPVALALVRHGKPYTCLLLRGTRGGDATSLATTRTNSTANNTRNRTAPSTKSNTAATGTSTTTTPTTTVSSSTTTPWGIQWAPCCHMPLVQKVRSHASGLARGSLVVAVNGVTVRDHDHVGLGRTLQQAWAGLQTTSPLPTTTTTSNTNATTSRLTITTVVCPPRAVHYERALAPNGPGAKPKSSSAAAKSRSHARKGPSPTRSYDGVNVSFVPFNYAVASLCAAQSPLACVHQEDDDDADDDSDDHNIGAQYHSHQRWPPPTTALSSSSAAVLHTVEQLAEHVAAGLMVAPVQSHHSRRQDDGGIVVTQPPRRPKYPPCPPLRRDQFLLCWDSLRSLVYCMRLASLGYAEDDDPNDHVPVEGDDLPSGRVSQRRAVMDVRDPMETLQHIVSSPAGAEVTGQYLLQFISLICAPPSIEQNDFTDGEKQSGTNASYDAKELTSMLLTVSRQNEAFCQRLYFLLRSYISTFESSGGGGDKSSRGGQQSSNLLALLHCLELLRFAEKNLEEKEHKETMAVPKAMEPQLVRQSKYKMYPVPNPITPESPAPESSKKAGLGLLRKKGTAEKKGRSPLQVGARLSPLRRTRKAAGSASGTGDDDVMHTTMASECSLVQSPSTIYEDMSVFLTELDAICGTMERSLQKSFSQKIADWALQPWSAGKDAALAKVTADMRASLRQTAPVLLVNPVESSEVLSSVDSDGCYILPSAHFPLLITFNVSEKRCSDPIPGQQVLYRTRVELVSLTSESASDHDTFSVFGALAGSVCESGDSVKGSPFEQKWNQSPAHAGEMTFETRSTWGAPQTLSLRVCGRSTNHKGHTDIGFSWLDISELWNRNSMHNSDTLVADIWPSQSAATKFDEHGDLSEEAFNDVGQYKLKVKVTTEKVEFDYGKVVESSSSQKRMLLYKHDDDLRQEAFAVQFIRTCDRILKASGLDMKLLTFQCIPVGARRGFVEWVQGSIPLSEICMSSGSKVPKTDDWDSPHATSRSKEFSKFDSLRRLGAGHQNESLSRMNLSGKTGVRGSIGNDPIQDFLRGVAFDEASPYFICRSVMDTYVKSSAGYSVITYILGVGDRHLDNLLLHQSGSLFHCDFSFILGRDPKTFLPMRITEDMILGMGGKESDNYAKFLSLVGAAFLALRRPENVRVVLSLVRLVEASSLPDVSQNQATETAILGVRDRLKLELTEYQALAYIEELVEASLSSKMWLAVDAIHELGKNF